MELGENGIGAITLFVEDLGIAKHFYSEVLGLQKVFEDGNSTAFKFGNALVNLLTTAAAKALIEPAPVAISKREHRFVITIPVEDVDATCARLIGRGATLLNGPMDRPWGIRTASFMDPDGHVWELAKW